jgi:hypothetical protein
VYLYHASIIDSKRHAAFLLGVHIRLLRGVQERAFDCEEDKLEENELSAHWAMIMGAAFALVDEFGETLYHVFESQILEVANWYGRAVQAPENLRKMLAICQREEWDKLEILGRRAVTKDGQLKTWYEVGGALAELKETVLRVEMLRSATSIDGDEAIERAYRRLHQSADALSDDIKGFLPTFCENPNRRCDDIVDTYETLNQILPNQSQNESRSQQLVPLTKCQKDIISTCEITKSRMTTIILMNTMESIGKDHGESTIKLALSALVKRKILENCPHCRPKGYGLPDWPHLHE